MKKQLLLAAAMVALLPSTPALARTHHVSVVTMDKQKIEAWGTKWKAQLEAGDIEPLRNMYEPDAVLMSNGSPPQVGVDAIMAFLKRNKTAGNAVTIDFENEEIVIDRDRAYLTAKYWMTITVASGAVIDVMGRSFLVYKKGEDGTWRLWRDMDNQAPDVLVEGRPVAAG